jgi:zinc transport system substrate-binding protein
MSLALTLVLAGCGSSGDGGGAASEAVASEASSPLDIVGSFYPLVFVAEQVGGEHVAVDNLTPPGAETHDLELTPLDVVSLLDADLIVYLAGFAPALDEAIRGAVAEQVFDVTSSASLDLEGEDHEGEEPESEHHDEDDHGGVDQDEDDHDEDDHDEDDHDEDDHGGVDPHFWLDPIRLADVADATAARLAEIDPENAESFLQNAAALRFQFDELDNEFQQGLAECARLDLVTSHRSFGYLANRYGLNQVGIAGLSPEQEPSAAQLANVSDLVRAEQVLVIYYEKLVDPGVAQTIADETGATTDVLDPLETLSETASGLDYFQVMRSNLATLRRGLDCS